MAQEVQRHFCPGVSLATSDPVAKDLPRRRPLCICQVQWHLRRAAEVQRPGAHKRLPASSPEALWAQRRRAGSSWEHGRRRELQSQSKKREMGLWFEPWRWHAKRTASIRKVPTGAQSTVTNGHGRVYSCTVVMV